MHKQAARLVEFVRNDKEAIERRKAVKEDIAKMWVMYRAAKEAGDVVDAPWGLDDATASVDDNDSPSAKDHTEFFVAEFFEHTVSSAGTVRSADEGVDLATCADNEEAGVGQKTDAAEKPSFLPNDDPLPSREHPGRKLMTEEGFNGSFPGFTRLPASDFFTRTSAHC